MFDTKHIVLSSGENAGKLHLPMRVMPVISSETDASVAVGDSAQAADAVSRNAQADTNH
jgi:hypothetical protein